MGADHSIERAEISIPISLRPIQPFLNDALRYLAKYEASIVNGGDWYSDDQIRGMKEVCVLFLTQAFRLVTILGVKLDNDAIICLNKFKAMRENLCKVSSRHLAACN